MSRHKTRGTDKSESRKTMIVIFVGLILFILLFLNLNSNFFSLIPSKWFSNWQASSDSSEQIVIDSLLGAREHGIGYSYGLMGSYVQQIGLQGIFLRIIDFLIPAQVLPISIFKGIFVSIFCVFILYLVYWSLKEFGVGAALALYLGVFFNRWIIASCANLYWASFTFLLPFISMLMLCKKEEQQKEPLFLRGFFAVSFFSILVRAACGFEMISTIMISVEIPIFYYAAKNGWGGFLKRFFATAVGAISAFFAALAINFAQQSFYFSSFQSAIDKMIYTISKRTGAFHVAVPPIFQESLEAPKWSVLQAYFINGEPLIGTMRMATIALVFGIATVCCFIGKAYSPTIERNRKKLQALSTALWVSFLGPLSWYILAAPHSYIHKSINYILWSYPYLLIGCILCGSIIAALLTDWQRPLKGWAKIWIPVLMITVLYFYADTFKVGQRYSDIVPQDGTLIESNKYADIYYYDSALYFLTSPENRSEKFFLHFYTDDSSATDVNEYGFVNKDFEFKENELKTYAWEDRKIARVKLNTEYAISTISAGQYNAFERTWEKEFDFLSFVHPPQVITPYNLSDDNWTNGISKDGTKILLESYDISIRGLKGKSLKMYSGEQVEIVDIEKRNNWFYLILDNPVAFSDGYPNSLEVMN